MNKSYVEKTSQGFNIMNLSQNEIKLIHDSLQVIASLGPVSIDVQEADRVGLYGLSYDSKAITEIYQKIEVECPDIKCTMRLRIPGPPLPQQRSNDGPVTNPKKINHIKPPKYNTQRHVT